DCSPRAQSKSPRSTPPIPTQAHKRTSPPGEVLLTASSKPYDRLLSRVSLEPPGPVSRSLRSVRGLARSTSGYFLLPPEFDPFPVRTDKDHPAPLCFPGFSLTRRMRFGINRD